MSGRTDTSAPGRASQEGPRDEQGGLLDDAAGGFKTMRRFRKSAVLVAGAVDAEQFYLSRILRQWSNLFRIFARWAVLTLAIQAFNIEKTERGQIPGEEAASSRKCLRPAGEE